MLLSTVKHQQLTACLCALSVHQKRTLCYCFLNRSLITQFQHILISFSSQPKWLKGRVDKRPVKTVQKVPIQPNRIDQQRKVFHFCKRNQSIKFYFIQLSSAEKEMRQGFELAAALTLVFAVGGIIYALTHLRRLQAWAIPILCFALVTLNVLSQFKGFEWMDSLIGRPH